ncbi:MAG TPA: nucleotidyltransferase family protein [Thermohalobaculum sp.]|nr:nucleotidyltransferase family protein [Thermohalobaculum sp.]
MSWTAVVLAGSRGAQDPVARAAGVSHKAFAALAGRPMIGHVLDALAAAPRIGEVIVVIEPGAPALPAGVRRLDAAASPARSALAGLEAAAPPVLLTTADHPLLTAQMVEHFLAAAEASGADVAAGVALRPVVEAAGSAARRTYLRFRDGEASGCNLFALMTPAARDALVFWQRLEAERKRPWRMARALGPLTLARYALGRLTMLGAATALGRAAGCRAAMLVLPFPDAAHDVDKPDDLAFAERRLGERGGR